MTMQTRQERTQLSALRRAAVRQNLTLVPSRRRDPRAVDYGLFKIADQKGRVVSPLPPASSGHDFGLVSLDEVRQWLAATDEERKNWRRGGTA